MPRESLLIRTLVELADNLVDEFDVIDLLSVLSERCVEVLDVAAAGVMLASPNGELHVVASSRAMRTLELFELQADEGPCLDCFRTGAAVLNRVLVGTDERWPEFSVRALGEGFRSVYALPMRLRGRTIGALNMFRTDATALGEADVLAAQGLADVATIAILQHQAAVSAQVLNTQLSEALNSRIIIEQARGKISEAAALDMDQAFSRLRNHARNHSVGLTELARDIAEGTVSASALDPLDPLV